MVGANEAERAQQDDRDPLSYTLRIFLLVIPVREVVEQFLERVEPCQIYACIR